MFIIYGSPRSGTTLLATTLNLHDDILIPPETDFIVPAAQVFKAISNPVPGKRLISLLITSTPRFIHSIGKFLSEEEISEIIDKSEYSFGSMIDDIYSAIADKTSKKLAGDKSPNDINFVAAFNNIGLFRKNTKIIHIVRDVRDVMLSIHKAGWTRPGFQKNIPRNWEKANITLHNIFKDAGNDRYFLVKYENLVADPASILKRIISFLGLPFQDKMLDHSMRGLEYAGKKPHPNLQKPFLKEKAYGWKKTMPEKLVRDCEKNAPKALRLFEYELSATENPCGHHKGEEDLSEEMPYNEDALIAERMTSLQRSIEELAGWGHELLDEAEG
jgi:hypothetical protein